MSMLVPRAHAGSSEGQSPVVSTAPGSPRPQSRRDAILKIGIGAAAACSGLLVSGCGAFRPNEPLQNNIDPRSNERLSQNVTLLMSPDYAGIGCFWLGSRGSYEQFQGSGYNFYHGHMGGYVDQNLEVINYERGIYLRFAYYNQKYEYWGDWDTGDLLTDILVFGNWKGEVGENGLRLGDPLEKFFDAYKHTKIGRSPSNQNKYWVKITMRRGEYTRRYIDRVVMVVEVDADNRIKSILLSSAQEAEWGKDLGKYKFMH